MPSIDAFSYVLDTGSAQQETAVLDTASAQQETAVIDTGGAQQETAVSRPRPVYRSTIPRQRTRWLKTHKHKLSRYICR